MTVEAIIRDALAAPDLDVDAALRDGFIILHSLEDLPPGFKPIVKLDETLVAAIAADFRYRLFEYRKELEILKGLRASGLSDFHQILRAFRAPAIAKGLSDRKVGLMQPKMTHGYRTVIRPYMGRMIEMQRDLVMPFHWLIVQQQLRPYLTQDLDAVLDIGCGAGDILAELAASDPGDRIEYLGGEIADCGRACVTTFGEILGKNLRGIPFDLQAPDFSCLKGKKNVLIISHFSLVYARPFPTDFWPKLFAATGNVCAVLFEPFSFAAPDLTSDPLFTLKHAQAYNTCENLYPLVRQLAQQGVLEIEEAVPDLSGLTATSALSLLRFRKKS